MVPATGAAVRAAELAQGGALPFELSAGDFFGYGGLAGLGDVDGDGVPDLAVGAYQDDDGGDDSGAVYVLRLTAGGGVKGNASKLSNAGGLSFELASRDRFGRAVASLGDLNGDGVGDVAVGVRSIELLL